MLPQNLQALFGVLFFVVGASHLFHPRRWLAFFRSLDATGHAPWIIALATAPVGLIIVAGHNDWRVGVPLILTVAGWGMLAKSALYLLAPGLGERAIRKLPSVRATRLAGAVLMALGAALGSHFLLRVAR